MMRRNHIDVHIFVSFIISGHMLPLARSHDPKHLPYWHIYEREEKDRTIKVGGTMAGVFTGKTNASKYAK